MKHEYSGCLTKSKQVFNPRGRIKILNKAIEHYKLQASTEGRPWNEDIGKQKAKELKEKIEKMSVKELVEAFSHFYPFRLDTLSKLMPFD